MAEEPEAEVTAVAARDFERARQFAPGRLRPRGVSHLFTPKELVGQP